MAGKEAAESGEESDAKNWVPRKFFRHRLYLWNLNKDYKNFGRITYTYINITGEWRRRLAHKPFTNDAHNEEDFIIHHFVAIMRQWCAIAVPKIDFEIVVKICLWGFSGVIMNPSSDFGLIKYVDDFLSTIDFFINEGFLILILRLKNFSNK